MSVSYAITVKDELIEIQQLIPLLLEFKQKDDEIVVQWDNTGDPEVWKYLDTQEKNVFITQSRFNQHFADWKNELNTHCSKKYIFNIDADELPSPYLIEMLPNILRENPHLDLILIPRINTVEGLTPAHIKQWGWNLNKNNWINYPDVQMRIYRNTPEIKWVNKVHEKLEGFKQYTTIVDDYLALIHHKTIARQERQNEFYSRIFMEDGNTTTSLN